MCDCGSVVLDTHYDDFGLSVCLVCSKLPEYSLLTLTESKQDYLLTDSEVKSLPHQLKPNRHSKHSNMLLFCRKQVEAFAIKKYGSLEHMDQVYEQRQIKKQASQQKKFNQKLAQLRARTRVNLVKEVHTHTFIDNACECGFTIDYEEF